MRKTKIVCTIGPASESEEMLAALCRAGMNVARLNFSHGTHADHKEKIERIKRVREKLHLPIAIMLDTKGPEYRIKTFAGGSATLVEGAEFTFTAEEVEGNDSMVSVSYAHLAEELYPGDRILVGNGLFSFEVLRTEPPRVICRVLEGGVLTDRKSMSFPGRVLHQPFLSEQDKADLLFGIENGVDYIACSFVSSAADLRDVHAFLAANGGEEIGLIAKIENQSGVDHIEEICALCEGIMIGRGDMGVELPFEEVPPIQKKLITKCRLLGKRVITATEMLESMIYNPRPTRAEISDVANAVYDGTSAVMLSAETAAGKHPVEAVEVMARVAETTEAHIDYKERFLSSEFKIRNTLDAISHGACGMAIDIGAKAMAVCSLSGMTARMVSRFRSPVDIVAITTNEKSWRKLALSWGVTPVMCEEFNSSEVLFYTAKKLAKSTFSLQTGDKIVITGGMTNGTSGNTNMIKIEEI
ncbi:MAG: pyruvate kinase [Ruminococcaceae bacterium]|nr:pyruvate kinase [Oscillospiraceae bacterium]